MEDAKRFQSLGPRSRGRVLEDNRRTIGHSFALALFLLAGFFAPKTAIASDAINLSARGDYRGAIELLEQSKSLDRGGKVLLGRLYLTTGQMEKAARQADALVKRPETRSVGFVLQARARALKGDYDAAIRQLRKVVEVNPTYFEARVVLAELLWMTGTPRQELYLVDEIADYWERGEVNGRNLYWLARALHLTEYFKDANSIYFELRDLFPDDELGLVGHARLFLEKEDESQAGQATEKLLSTNPHHPDALVLSAQMDLSSDGNPKKAMERAQKALAVNPQHVGAMRVIASAYVETEQYEQARNQLESALKINAKDPDTLALRAALELLAENRRGFERWMKKALAVNPRFAAGYHRAAELIVRVHRYREAIELDKQALRLDGDYAQAWVGLGVGLSRVGKDAEANEALQKAFELDSFNVRAYNMTRFFYDGPVKDMDWHKVGPYRIRLHRREKTVLLPLVSKLVTAANEKYEKQYEFRPKHPLHIEIFPERSTFEIRTAGYPRLGVHAVCFGNVITSRSPSEGTFNWGMVLWHELAHVWHIQMSNSRVPRWFTEGLAEYETAVERVEWRREMDEVLHSWFVQGKLKSIQQFNSMFIHADGLMDVVVAYYYSTQVVRFIVEQWGYAVVPKMLRAWGKKQSTAEVFTGVLDISLDSFNQRLKDWLRDTYLARYREATRASAAADASEAERAYWLGLDLMRRRQGAKALVAFEDAISKGGDGPAIHLDLARAAIAMEKYSLARDHLAIAGKQDPQQVAIHAALLAALEKLGDSDGAYLQRQYLANLREDDVRLAVLVALEAHKRGDKAVLQQYAERALDIAPFDRDVRTMMGRSYLADGQAKQAIAEAQLALSLPSESDNQLGAKLVLAEAYLDLGNKEDAMRALDGLPQDNLTVQSLRKRL
jgi:tetratricopeptide (TPR) repeat protein